MTRVTAADQLCVAAETILRENVTTTQLMLGFDLGEIETWQQLPTPDAIAAAQLPAVAITSPGLAGAPVWNSVEDGYDAVFVLTVGIYVRGKSHADTAARVRDWCAAIRSTIVRKRTLGGLSPDGATWVDETYVLIPDRTAARTLGAGAVAFNVPVLVPDPASLPTTPGTALPTVESVDADVVPVPLDTQF